MKQPWVNFAVQRLSQYQFLLPRKTCLLPLPVSFNGHVLLFLADLYRRHHHTFFAILFISIALPKEI
jgi:hypothetical protein